MIIFLSDLQREHLNLLHQHSVQVLVDFCKLAIDYLNNGSNDKKYIVIAEKLSIPVATVRNLVHALVYLLIEACKYNLSDQDFRSSLTIAGFSDDRQEVLQKFYANKKLELSSALNLLQQKDPSYQDFTWRFEIQVASRLYGSEIKPMVAMDWKLMIPKNYGQNDDGERKQMSETINDNKIMSPVHINSSIQDAKAASHCQYIINHVLLQCDLQNLVHLTNKLEEALKESKSQHVRKVQRAL